MIRPASALYPTQPVPIGYEVRNLITGVTKFYSTSLAATNAMDRTDSAYGRCITTRRAIWS